MNDFNPLVSIVIPVYNGSNYMKEAIDSALAQTYKNIEVIVVNDGSTDSTDEIARSYGDKIRYFKKENGGVATALNLAIQNANGEYISWLSHDDVYFENKIEEQIKELKKLWDRNTILYSNCICINEYSEYIGKTEYQNISDINKLENTLYPVMFSIINGCTLLIPKNCFDRIGYFDTTLKTTQDYALWYKLFPKCNVHFMSQHLIKVRIHKEQGSKLERAHQAEQVQLWGNIIESISNDEIDKMYDSRAQFWFELSERYRFKNWSELQLKALMKIVHINSENLAIRKICKKIIHSYVKTGGLCKFKKDIRRFVKLMVLCTKLIANFAKNEVRKIVDRTSVKAK